MSIVNFTVTKPLEKKINRAIKQQGFTSKAEFFRFITLTYLQSGTEAEAADDEARFRASVRLLKRTLRQKINFKKLPSLQAQLADLR